MNDVSGEAIALRNEYDAQLRGECELHRAILANGDGPLFRAVFDSNTGFVSHRSLDGFQETSLDELIERTVAYFRDHTTVTSFEWKTRGHDSPADFTERLRDHGFEPEEMETVMIGKAQLLMQAPDIPADIVIRRIGGSKPGVTADRNEILRDVERMFAMQAEVFGDSAPESTEHYTEMVLDQPEVVEAWIAEVGDEVVSAGRLEVVVGTDFAGLWGGSTRAEWRGRGIYRALTAARARSAVAKGVVYLHSDCTDASRPILARSGLTAVTTTTPYIWRRP